MQHRKTLMLVLTALFAALTAIGAFFKIPFALAAISLQFLFTAMAGIWISCTLPSCARLLPSSTLDFQEPMNTMAA